MAGKNNSQDLFCFPCCFFQVSSSWRRSPTISQGSVKIPPAKAAPGTLQAWTLMFSCASVWRTPSSKSSTWVSVGFRKKPPGKLSCSFSLSLWCLNLEKAVKVTEELEQSPRFSFIDWVTAEEKIPSTGFCENFWGWRDQGIISRETAISRLAQLLKWHSNTPWKGFRTLKHFFCWANSKMVGEKNWRLKFARGERAAAAAGPCRASWNKVLQGILENVLSKTCTFTPSSQKMRKFISVSKHCSELQLMKSGA